MCVLGISGGAKKYYKKARPRPEAECVVVNPLLCVARQYERVRVLVVLVVVPFSFLRRRHTRERFVDNGAQMEQVTLVITVKQTSRVPVSGPEDRCYHDKTKP